MIEIFLAHTSWKSSPLGKIIVSSFSTGASLPARRALSLSMTMLLGMMAYGVWGMGVWY